MNSSCKDLRVTDDSENELDYEIEVSGCNTAYTRVWARGNLTAQTSNTTFYMYYGNSVATDNQNKEGVWINGYSGIMHFGNATDSINGVTWNNSGGVSFTTIDNKRVANFTSASNQYLLITGTDDYRWINDTTVTVFWKPYSSGQTILSVNAEITGTTGWMLEGGAGTNFGASWGWASQAPGGDDLAYLNLNVNNPLYHHLKLNTTDRAIYENATLIASGGKALADLDGRVIGRRGGTFSPYSDAYIDELRWSNVTRTDQWMRAEIGQLYSLGAEELSNEAPVVNLLSPANDTTVNSNGYSATFIAFVYDSEHDIDNCTLNVWNVSDDTLKYTQTNTSIINATNVSFVQVLMASNYTWNIHCIDNQSLEGFNATNWTINVIPIPDNAPVVTLNSPANDTTYTTSPVSIDFNCTASDDINLVNVSLIIDGSINLTNISGINNSDYIFSPSAFSDGSYTWSCRGIDNASQSTQPTARDFLVDGTNPNITITAPVDNFNVTEFNETITLNWTAEDNNIDTCFYNFPQFVIANKTFPVQWFDNINESYRRMPIGIYNFSVIDQVDTIWFYTFAPVGNVTVRNSLDIANNCTSSSGLYAVDLNISYASAVGDSDRYYTFLCGSTQIAQFLVDASFGTKRYPAALTSEQSTTNFVTCNDNTTTFNYPSTNPNNITVMMFVNDTTSSQTNPRNDNDYITILKSTSAPQITLTGPVDLDYHVNASDIYVNWTITNATELDTCWYSYNGANTTVTCEDTADNFAYINTVNTLTFYSNDTLGNLNSTTRTWTIKAVETGIAFTSTVFEGTSEEFQLNITTATGIFVSEARLIYGTTVNDTSTLRVSGNNYRVENTIEIPDVTVEENKTFYWEILLSDSTQATSTQNNQTVQPINIDNCSNYTVVLYNLTLYDEQSKEFITPGGNNSTRIEVDLDIFSSTGQTAFLTLSEDFINTNPAQICLDQNITTQEYRANIQIRYSSTGKVIELYHIDSDELTNSTIPRQIGLYDLNTSFSQTFELLYEGVDFLPVAGAIFQIKRKYIGDGSFEIVEAPKSDEEGKAVGHFQEENVVYDIVVTKNGTILASFQSVAVRCQNSLTDECTLQLEAFESSSNFSNWLTVGDLVYTMLFSEDSRRITVQFNTVSGSARNVTIIGQRLDNQLNTTVCTDSLLSSAGTLTCDISSVYGNLTILSYLYSDSVRIATNVFQIQPDLSEFLGEDSYFFALVLLMILPMLFIPSTIAMVIATILGIMLSMSLFLLEGGNVFSQGAALTWLIIAGFIIIWKLARRDTV
jgi:hypothetical protein